ncbi:hypothetical protein UB44_16745 [Burkholderiaceae bacterium 26]|nr:hypothetical protein UB44_16745 [Burkholderiaceae bacterium 26]
MGSMPAMVDEFQDMSPGRARLVKALLAQHRDSVLFGVGDDWQAIYGFTGSDLQLFMGFEKVFGATSENLLSKTSRSTIKNDPLLEMMLSMHDTFPFAEERRLFYVALTRAKNKCFVFFRQRDISPFALELMSPEFSKAITYRAGPLPKRCGTCGKGFLLPRPSHFNKPFLGCSRYSPNGGCEHQETI